MARLCTVGFELGTTEYRHEYNDINSSDGYISDAPYFEGGKAFHVRPGETGDGYIQFSDTAKDGPYFARVRIYVTQFPDTDVDIAFFAEHGVEFRAGIVMQSDGRVHLREGDTGTQIGPPSEVLKLNTEYILEIQYTNRPSMTSARILARMDGVLFANTELSSTYGPVNMFGWGVPSNSGNFEIYFDDIAVNDALPDAGGNIDQASWPGRGRLVLWTPTNLDNLGNEGWIRGGTDNGDDAAQLAVYNSSRWDDSSVDWDDLEALWDSADLGASSWLVSANNGDRVDFRVTNPYSLGILEEDTIKLISAQIRWRNADTSSSTSLSMYLRAGSNLAKSSRVISLTKDEDWTGNTASEAMLDVIAVSRLPQSPAVWTPSEVASLRVGLESIDSNPDIFVVGIWGYIEYVEYSGDLDYSVTINGVERAHDMELQSLSINDQINEQANTADFVLYDLHSLGVPETDDEIIVEVNGVRLFAGFITKVTYDQLGNLADKISISCVDYTKTLDRRLVSATFLNMSDKDVIDSVVDQFVDDNEVSTYFVSESAMVSQVSFNYIPASQAIKQVAELTSQSWYIDYYKRIHYFPRQQSQAPFQVTSASAYHKNLQLTKDNSRLRNRVFVRGGTELTSDPVSETQVADGEQRQFFLAEKPHELSVTVNGSPETVGIKNIDDPDLFDWMMNFQEKYIEAGALRATPTAGDKIAVSYKYDVPILVSVEDPDSIEENGVYEFVIIDNNIATTQQARDRARAELTDYANDIVDATYSTYQPGVMSGQYQRISMANKGVDEDYLVNTVTLRSLGGGRFVYEVKLTNAKTLGIIKFLLDLLQTDRRVGNIDPNEKVDQLFTLTDTLDSIMDSLVTDSYGLHFKWAPASGSGDDLKWDLGQWS